MRVQGRGVEFLVEREVVILQALCPWAICWFDFSRRKGAVLTLCSFKSSTISKWWKCVATLMPRSRPSLRIPVLSSPFQIRGSSTAVLVAGAKVAVLQRPQAGGTGGRVQPALPTPGLLEAPLLRPAGAAAVLLRDPPFSGDGGRHQPQVRLPRLQPSDRPRGKPNALQVLR